MYAYDSFIFISEQNFKSVEMKSLRIKKHWKRSKSIKKLSIFQRINQLKGWNTMGNKIIYWCICFWWKGVKGAFSEACETKVHDRVKARLISSSINDEVFTPSTSDQLATDWSTVSSHPWLPSMPIKIGSLRNFEALWSHWLIVAWKIANILPRINCYDDGIFENSWTLLVKIKF